MAFRFLEQTTLLAALLTQVLAQTPSIPADLSASFKKEVQVAFSDNAVNGFTSGTVFSKSDVADEPTFALGDSNGISPSTLYTLLMVDTTCSTRVLHYARSNFKFAFAGGTNIETDSPPLLDYAAPGAFGEQGGRQYVFLMYTNPARREISELQLPGRGEAFDVKAFQADNGLPDAVAGVGMVVELGGDAACDGGSAPAPEESEAASSSAGAEAPSQTARPSAPNAPATSQTATPPAASPTPSRPSPSPPASTPSTPSAPSAPPQESSEVEQSAAPSSAEQDAAPTSVASSPQPSPSDAESDAPASAIPTPSAQPEDATPTATPIESLSSVLSSVTGSPTTSGGPLQQSANAAADVSAGVGGVFVAHMVVIAGVLAW